MNRHERRKMEASSGYGYSAKNGGKHRGSKKGYHKGCFGKSLAQKKVAQQ